MDIAFRRGMIVVCSLLLIAGCSGGADKGKGKSRSGGSGDSTTDAAEAFAKTTFDALVANNKSGFADEVEADATAVIEFMKKNAPSDIPADEVETRLNEMKQEFPERRQEVVDSFDQLRKVAERDGVKWDNCTFESVTKKEQQRGGATLIDIEVTFKSGNDTYHYSIDDVAKIDSGWFLGGLRWGGKRAASSASARPSPAFPDAARPPVRGT